MKLFRKAILIVHGFAGGVYDFELLSKELECVSNYDVFTFTLPGHEGGVNEKITYNSWIEKSEREVEYLINKGYKKIYLIGHSMGGVIATYLASKYPQIKKLILAAPAFRYFGFEDGKKLHYSSLVQKPYEMIKQYGSKMVINRAFKLPINCVFEFRKLVDKYAPCVSDVKIDTLIFWGTLDKVVPKESIDYVYNNIGSKNKKIVYMEGLTHNLINEDVNNHIVDEIKCFLKHNLLYKFDIKTIEK